MLFLRSILNRWEIQNRAKQERETKDMAESIVMRMMPAVTTGLAKWNTEQLKLKVEQAFLKEEMLNSDQEATEMAENIIMRAIDIASTQQSKYNAEQLKLKVQQILLGEEISDYNYNEFEPDNWNSPQSTNGTGKIEPDDKILLQLATKFPSMTIENPGPYRWKPPETRLTKHFLTKGGENDE